MAGRTLNCDRPISVVILRLKPPIYQLFNLKATPNNVFGFCKHARFRSSP